MRVRQCQRPSPPALRKDRTAIEPPMELNKLSEPFDAADAAGAAEPDPTRQALFAIRRLYGRTPLRCAHAV